MAKKKSVGEAVDEYLERNESSTNYLALVPCECGETLMCLCGRCKKCGKQRGKNQFEILATEVKSYLLNCHNHYSEHWPTNSRLEEGHPYIFSLDFEEWFMGYLKRKNLVREDYNDKEK